MPARSRGESVHPNPMPEHWPEAISDVEVAVFTPNAVPQMASGPRRASSPVTVSEDSISVPMPSPDPDAAPASTGAFPCAAPGSTPERGDYNHGHV